MLKKILPSILMVLLALGGLWFAYWGKPIARDSLDAYTIFSVQYNDQPAYEVRFRDNLANQAKSIIIASKTPPLLRTIDKNMIEMRLATSDYSNLCYYFDRETGRLSPAFVSPLFIHDDKVVLAQWLEGQGQIVVRNCFTGEVITSMPVDFAPMPTFAEAIVSIESLGENLIEVRYWEGSDAHKAVQQIILPHT